MPPNLTVRAIAGQAEVKVSSVRGWSPPPGTLIHRPAGTMVLPLEQVRPYLSDKPLRRSDLKG